MSEIQAALTAVVEGAVLPGHQMQAVMDEVLAGEASSAQIAAFAIALRMREETAGEIAAAVRALRGAAHRVDLASSGPLVDTCGTGGDGVGSINISTLSAIVVAGAGVCVAKHGNRAVSSRSGSADVLEALGVQLECTDDVLRACLRDARIAFLFAPAHHAALRHVAPTRRELGMRTFFNLLGPLANPAGATHQLVGVYERRRTTQMAEVLRELGVVGAWVVHGEGGLDGIAPTGTTHVSSWNGSIIEEFEVTPSSFGLDSAPLSSLEGGDAQKNARIARRILGGEKGGPRQAVLANAGAALFIAGAATTLEQGAALAAASIDDGAAEATLKLWVERSGG